MTIRIDANALCLAIALLCSGANAHDADIRATIDSGVLAGRASDGLDVFLGVPFAAAPVGPGRWRPPAPMAKWPGVRAATQFGPACLQKGVSIPGEPAPRMDEDCLYLNIWAPAHRAAGGVPVMVWIHGGGYTNGATALPLYWGDRLARKGVVFVSINYRLGPLGYLAHPELSRESGDGVSGDYGLLDQIAALRWIGRNVAAFGGDPKSVTICGQSAGAMSVSLLMASPLAKGLIQRAIAQSGGVFEPLQLAPDYQLAQAEKEGVAYARSLGAFSVAELRALPAERLLGGTANAISHPVVEPVILPLSPYQAYLDGTIAPVPILIGYNAEEARSLADVKTITAATFTSNLDKTWGHLPDPIVAAYRFTTDAQAKQARLDLERDLRFGWDMSAWARLQAAAQRPVFMYRFEGRVPFPADGVRANWGASHYSELWYMFDHLNQEPLAWSTDDRRLADTMATYWTNFAKTDDPNDGGLPKWPRFETNSQNLLVLDDAIAPGRIANPDQLQVFDAIYGAVRGAPLHPLPPLRR